MPGPQSTAVLPQDPSHSAQGRAIDHISSLPYWLILILLVGLFLTFQLSTNESYVTAFNRIIDGIFFTLFVTVVSYTLAILLGLIAGLGRVSKNVVVFNLATLYVQVIRGIPILVQMLYWAFVIVPGIIILLNLVGTWLAPLLGSENFFTQVNTRDVDFVWRCIFALAFAYGGFEAETFRAGIESIGKGQMEASRSLGMSYAQSMRYIILPQAIRRVLPPLGNDLISMLKDSSLVAVLGVRDMTQEARLLAAANFRYVETLTTLAFMYLGLTLVLSMFVRFIENRWKQL